jgi:hypothetical protein
MTEMIYGGEGACPTCFGQRAKPRIVVQHVDGEKTRITENVYDWRGRLIETFGEEDVNGQSLATRNIYDNLGRVVKTEQFVSVEAAYSKHRRDDIQLLHPDIVERFLKWLEIRQPAGESEVLFPISGKTGGVGRRTSEMMMFDLNFVRNLWLSEAKDGAERQKRLASDFLRYQDTS